PWAPYLSLMESSPNRGGRFHAPHWTGARTAARSVAVDLAAPRSPRRGPGHVRELVHGRAVDLVDHEKAVRVENRDDGRCEEREQAHDPARVRAATELVEGERVVGEKTVPRGADTAPGEVDALAPYEQGDADVVARHDAASAAPEDEW